MEKLQDYNGYVLRAHPFEIDHLHWTVDVEIERHLDDGRVKRERYEKPGETRFTVDKAIVASLEFGQRIVDQHEDLPLP